MRRVMALGGLLAVLVIGGTTAGPSLRARAADETARRDRLSQAGDLHRRLREAEAAKKSAEVKALLPEFTAAVQAAAADLPSVTPEESAKPRNFRKVTLNADKTRLDGFRFRVPDGQAVWNLSWEFVYPKGAATFTWGLAAREGAVDGFRNFARKDNYAEKGADLPAENRRVTQRLSGGKLRGGAEYVIWFAFDGDQPVDIHVRLGLTPAGK